MPMVIITAEVQDAVKWEAGFRTHSDLFRSYALRAAVTPIASPHRKAPGS